ncbi:hypothetical protein K1719_008116 [Acacia pycnantha]|nr:hypothetical protein K1719_008116 [Acacia pycnantha]
MASSWFFILLLKCLDFLSWPVLALGYPLCASVEAIESDSHSETRNLISYWILLSLIYFFEYAFLKLLQWFQYWHYMKLMIVAFLVTPDFGRAAYVYNKLIRSCIYMNPQAVISRFRSWKNIFAKKEDLIMQVEKCITQNGTEALEKLIASKNIEQSLHAETRKAVPTCTEKIEILETNRGRLLMEQKDIKYLEMIEKEEVPEGQQANNAALDGLTSKSSMETIEKMSADTEYGTYPQISATENVQKEWTCAICQLTVSSEANLNSHLQGRKHKAACEALNTKTKGTPVKDTGSGASPQDFASENVQKTWTCDICQLIMLEVNMYSHLRGKKHKAAASEALNTKTEGTTGTDTGSEASPHVSASTNVQKTWTCAVCQLTKLSEANVKSHLQGRQHKAALKALKRILSDTGERPRKRASPQVSASQNEQKMWTCEICQLTKLSFTDLNCHLQGRKHKASLEALSSETKGTVVADTGSETFPQVSGSKNEQIEWTWNVA